ncbi:hypothetical protein ACFY1B_51785 [Streptomyces mirabilis]|uniref:hypothetical protein n=1 Tax=Streptomyces mirabilis TaxID=68239 RepID=UPI0036801FBD
MGDALQHLVVTVVDGHSPGQGLVDVVTDRIGGPGGMSGNIDHPLDAFTRQAAADYIQLRHSRWPHTRNPHLFLSSQTAHSRTPVTIGWMQPLLKDLPVTAQRLREDRILEEAAVTGADPQHLCAVFNITPDTGLRYTRTFHPDPLSY